MYNSVEQDGIVVETVGTYVKQIFNNYQSAGDGVGKIYEEIISNSSLNRNSGFNSSPVSSNPLPRKS